MPAPAQVKDWLRQHYPKPDVDPQWLDECYAWIEGEFRLNPITQFDDIVEHINSQLLQSDLRDSTIAGTGLPPNVTEEDDIVLTGPPVLVEIVAITEIGHSAFSLQQVRQARLEHADLEDLEDENDEDEGPIPKYPRSMLKLQLSDGTTTIQAIEYRRLPELTLGETQLGYKMLLKNVPVRRGVAFLEPKCVVMKGHYNADREALQDVEFARSLRQRLGQPEDPARDIPQDPPPPAHAAQADNAIGRPVRPRAPPSAPASGVRSPLRELSEPVEPPVAGPSRISHDDDEGQPRRRKLPTKRSPSPDPPPRAQPPTHSRYFSATGNGRAGTGNAADLAREGLFSPHRYAPLFAPDSDEDDWAALDSIDAGPGPSATLVASGEQGASRKIQDQVQNSDFDYDFDAELEEQELLELERVEREAMTASAGSARGRSVTIATSSSTTQTSSMAVVPGLSGIRTAVVRSVHSSTADEFDGDESESESPGARGNEARALPARIDLGVITIEDSDEDDKENVPLPTRHVRRRMERPPDDDDVIEISD
ncbi:hypothetical protein OBBRIDRAFT_823487 [Obba rivulosa]|uniref:RecQ-mediated genome instability protein 1 n=1 Tax=Obba rivulosa TaxID=1052685 RepID=A0A8E2DRC3_9APHY|nr:hypothetical protein OBBRIDRAFT_823487 [Obba rivulosa]